jgi:serpin B
VVLGARGETAREMATALGWPADRAAMEAAAHAETSAWEAARGKAELVVANRVWLDAKLGVLPAYLDATKASFGAAPSLVDFRANAEGARTTINQWVEAQTADKIKDLLPRGSVNAQSRLVVTNAIYFKAGWALPFSTSGTKVEPFHVDATRTVKAPLMHATDSFRYGQARGAKVLELRYQDTDLSMLVVLPDDANGLPRVEQDLSDEALKAWTQALAPQRVAVTLPKFTFKSGGSIAAWLRDLGVRLAFGDHADFGDIASERIAVSEVVHQTWIATDEKGTEAAAATAVVMRATALIMGPVAEFKADRPFLFLLRDAKRGRVLFAGRVADPTSKGN